MDGSLRFRPLSWGLFFNENIILNIGCTTEKFSSPFLGTFFQFEHEFVYTMLSHGSFRPLSWGLFFNLHGLILMGVLLLFSSPFLGTFFQSMAGVPCLVCPPVFVPFLGDFFSIIEKSSFMGNVERVFVPFLGDFFSIACLRSPSPSALESAFAAGMGGSLHQALSFGDEMPISQSGRASAGICNEKIEMRNGGAAHKNMEPPRRFETSDFLVSQT